ncbi:MAG: hypothetical protein ACRBF0_14750 [Calditrichia bacterium]
MKRIHYSWQLKDNDEQIDGDGTFFILNEENAVEEVASTLSKAWPEAKDIEVKIDIPMFSKPQIA